MLAASNVVTLSREQRDALLTYVWWQFDDPQNLCWSDTVERADVCRTARLAATTVRLLDTIGGWKNEGGQDSYEIKVDDDVAWLMRDLIEPLVHEGRRLRKEDDLAYPDDRTQFAWRDKREREERDVLTVAALVAEAAA